MKKSRFSWLFLFIVEWEGWQGRTRLHTSRRCHFIIPRHHTCEFSAKKINRNDLSNISNLGHFAFHFIATIWDFLYLICEYIFCSKMVWMMSWFYKMTSSSGKWAGPPLLPPTQHESENSIEFQISWKLMILNPCYDFRSGLYTLTVCLKS